MLIGLTGYAGSGKDTAAAYLVWNHEFKRVAFADKLRELTYAENPAIYHGGDHVGSLRRVVDRYGWDTAKREFPHVREILQDVGMAHREVFGENFWVGQAIDPLLEYDITGHFSRVPPSSRVVITDVRFPNEAARVRELGGTVVRIERPGVGAVNAHVSENPIEADHVICNKEGGVWNMYFALDHLIATGKVLPE